MTEKIEVYAERYFQRSGKTKFPTVREVARRFGMRQDAVSDACDGNENLMLTSFLTAVPTPIGEHYVEVINAPGIER